MFKYTYFFVPSRHNISLSFSKHQTCRMHYILNTFVQEIFQKFSRNFPEILYICRRVAQLPVSQFTSASSCFIGIYFRFLIFFWYLLPFPHLLFVSVYLLFVSVYLLVVSVYLLVVSIYLLVVSVYDIDVFAHNINV